MQEKLIGEIMFCVVRNLSAFALRYKIAIFCFEKMQGIICQPFDKRTFGIREKYFPYERISFDKLQCIVTQLSRKISHIAGQADVLQSILVKVFINDVF